MMFQFSENMFNEVLSQPDIGFYPLAQKMRDDHSENIVLAQYLLIVGMQEYAKQFDIEPQKVKDLLFSLGINPLFKPKVPIEDTVVRPCGGCGGGIVR